VHRQECKYVRKKVQECKFKSVKVCECVYIIVKAIDKREYVKEVYF
jgi:hypothetical protein